MLPYIAICVAGVAATLLLSRGAVLRGIIWGFCIASIAGLSAAFDVASSEGFGNAAIFELFFACYGAWLGAGIHAYRLNARPAAYVSLGCFAVFVVYSMTLWD